MAWEDVLRKEEAWWGNCAATADEEAKQLTYARLMGIEETYRISGRGWVFPPFDLQNKRVLDIGGGPVSLLLKCVNFRKAVVLDPGCWPAWVLERYKAAGIEYLQVAAEDAHLGGVFDEVWMYNTLQHVRDPEAVIQLALSHGRVVRVFEWLETEINELHPHSFSKAWLDERLGVEGREIDTRAEIGWERYARKAYAAVVRPGQSVAPGEETWHPTPEEWRQMRFHLLGLAHIPTHPEYSACAYTQKVVKLARMLKSLGHTVLFYGTEESQVECDEFVQVSSRQDRVQTYGDYDWRSEFFKHDPKDHAHQVFNANAVEAINARKQDGDLLLCPMGNYQQSVAQGTGVTTVESGVGYRGVFAQFKVFESYTWMMYVYGLLNYGDGFWYDCVIPNYFDPVDFPYQEQKEDYFLFIGRLIKRKGLDVAVQTTREIGARLVVAGQGTLVNETEGLNITDRHVEHVGTVGPEERARLMGGARAVFVPTYYIEPFGGVAVEAQLCGTPVITTDWGVFSETVVHGVTGWRCRTFDDFVWAAYNVDLIQPAACREWAVSNYSMDRVRWMYQEYFEKLDDLRRRGWYEFRPKRRELGWLMKYYPHPILGGGDGT